MLYKKVKIGGVGYKIPTAEVLSGIDYMTTPPGLLREPDSVTDNFNSEQTPPGLLREPDFVLNSNSYEQTSSGLLWEPDSADNFKCK